MSAIPDKPVGVADDELNRAIFARSIADQIIEAPPGGSLRIGVYGAWGEGKTSVLDMVKAYLRAEDHRVISIAPWGAASKDDLLREILEKLAVEFELDASAIGKARSRAELATRIREAARDDWRTKAADLLFGNTVEQFFVTPLDGLAASILNDVRSQLAGKKLAVMVDDLDRVRPQYVPELLLTLREVLDQPDFCYVLALAPDIVSEALSSVHAGWGNGRQFLEKIVELPRQLPSPSPAEWAMFIERQVKRLGAVVRGPTLLALAPLLPNNPRRAKLVLRHIASLHRLFARFQDEELDWQSAYIAQMLMLEYPDEARRALADGQVVRGVEFSVFSAPDLTKPAAKGEAPVPETAYAPEQQGPYRARFLELFSAFRESRSSQRGAYTATQLFHLADEPPLLTWKDVSVFTDDFIRHGSAGVPELLARQIGSASDIVKSLFAKVLEWRQQLLDAAADADLETALLERLEQTNIATRIIRDLVERQGVFEQGLLGSDEWLALYHQAASWAHFATQSYYQAVRAEERDLLRRSLAAMPTTGRIAVMNSRRLVYETRQRPSPEFTELTDELRRAIQSTAVDDVLRRFEALEGVEQLRPLSGLEASRLLFDPDSPLFREESVRARLFAVAEKAATNTTVQTNFLGFLSMLAHGATNGGHYRKSDCEAIVRDEGLLRVLWRAATRRPLNPRTSGTLGEYRRELARVGASVEAMPLPRWWQGMSDELDTP